jgi:hypothetical protein
MEAVQNLHPRPPFRARPALFTNLAHSLTTHRFSTFSDVFGVSLPRLEMGWW